MGRQPKLSRECWAACLGGCSTQESKEHVISRSIVGKFVRFVVLGAEKVIGRDSFTVPILCRTHNSALSPVDAAARKFIRFVQAYRSQPLSTFDIGDGPRDELCLKVDGRLLERWMAKTFLNMMAARIALAGDSLSPPISLSGRHIVDYVFGRTSEAESVSLYLLDPARTPIPESERNHLLFRAAPVCQEIEIVSDLGKSEGEYDVPLYMYLNAGGIELVTTANVTDLSGDRWRELVQPAPRWRALQTSQQRPPKIVMTPSVSEQNTKQLPSLVLDFDW
jgi:hypothetical protein